MVVKRYLVVNYKQIRVGDFSVLSGQCASSHRVPTNLTVAVWLPVQVLSLQSAALTTSLTQTTVTWRSVQWDIDSQRLLQFRWHNKNEICPINGSRKKRAMFLGNIPELRVVWCVHMHCSRLSLITWRGGIINSRRSYLDLVAKEGSHCIILQPLSFTIFGTI